MSVFQAVNTTLPVPDPSPARPGDETTPTTPRPNTQFFSESRPVEDTRAEDPRAEDPSAKTPTRNSFMAQLLGKSGAAIAAPGVQIEGDFRRVGTDHSGRTMPFLRRILP